MAALVFHGLFLLLVLNSPASALDRPHPLAPPDVSSPRATLTTYFRNMTEAVRLWRKAMAVNTESPGLSDSEEALALIDQAQEFGRLAALTMNTSETASARQTAVAIESILMLKEVLDRVALPPRDEIPDAAAVKAEGTTRWRVPDTEIEIALVDSGSRAGQFLFTAETLERIPEFYGRVRDLPYMVTGTEGIYEHYITTPGVLLPPKWLSWVERLPAWATALYHDQTGWQWGGMVLSVLLTVWLPFLCRRWLRHRPVPLTRVRRTWRGLLVPVVTLGSLVFFRQFVDEVLNITGVVLEVIVVVYESLIALAAAWIVIQISNVIAATINSASHRKFSSLDSSMVRMSFRVIGVIGAVGVILFSAERIGLPVVPLLAGLGVGGLAVALAARPTLENLIGGVILYADRPVRVGDFCKFGDNVGTVETIGMRSTQIRGLDRTVISVPNAQFVDMQLVNYARCDRMLIDPIVGLRYETSPEQLRFVLAKLREMLLAHPRIDGETVRVRFSGFGNSSLDIELRVYALTRDWNNYHAIREDIFLRIIDIVAEAGTGFAFPSTTAYLARDGGLDEENGRAAAAQVQAWRESGSLPFPEFAKETKEALAGSLSYPPAGSPHAGPESSKKLPKRTDTPSDAQS